MKILDFEWSRGSENVWVWDRIWLCGFCVKATSFERKCADLGLRLIGKEYEYTFAATDPDDDDVKYYIDWGDGTHNGWTSSHESGEKVTISHTWDERGDYTIRAKAKDTYNGVESDWTTLEVTMPRDRFISFPFLNNILAKLFGQFPLLLQLLGL